MNKQQINIIFILFSFSFSSYALNKIPIDVEADTVVVDERRGVSTYSGDARVTQGALTLNAEKIQIFNTKSIVIKVVAKGNKSKPAHYKHNQLNQPRFVEATALKITYFADRQFIHLQGNAHLTQGFDSFSGGTLDYDIKNDKIIAKKAKNNTQRVKFKIRL